MAKATKKEVKQDEVEVFGADKVVEGGATTPAPAETVAVSGKEFPERAEKRLSEYKVPMFFVIQIGDQARVYGKRGEPVSTITTLTDASRQASRHNATDPEQQAAKARGKK